MNEDKNPKDMNLEEELEYIKNPLAYTYLVLERKPDKNKILSPEEVALKDKEEFDALLLKDETATIQAEFDRRERLLDELNRILGQE